jgi:transposase
LDFKEETGMSEHTVIPQRTIGLDVGDRFTQLCVLGTGGEVLEEGQVASTREAFQARFEGVPPARVVLEVGAQSAWMSRALESWGHEVLVANSYQMGRIYRGQDKSDRRDAQTLARIGRSDPALLWPIRHRGAQAMADRSLLRSREILVRSRASLVNHVRGAVKTVGARLPACGTAQFARRVGGELPAELREALAPIVDTIQELTDRIRAYDREIERVAVERYPQTALFEPIDGVGPITRLAYVLSVEDPHRFAKSRDVGSYVGLRPKRRQSGDDDPELPITRAGDPQLRRLLVQCAHYILGPFGRDSDLRRFGLKLAARGGRAAKKRAVVAVARKLAVLLHRLWITGEDYEPLYLARKRGEAA